MPFCVRIRIRKDFHARDYLPQPLHASGSDVLLEYDTLGEAELQLPLTAAGLHPGRGSDNHDVVSCTPIQASGMEV